jgi:hypothetical protein
MAFHLEVVDIGIADGDGKPITSVVLNPVEYTREAAGKASGLGYSQKKALSALQELYKKQRANLEISGQEPSQARVEVQCWKDALLGLGIVKNRQSFFGIKRRLIDRKLINIDEPYVYLANENP